MDETFAEAVERLAKELHEKVYIPNATALGYIIGPQADVPFENLPQEGQELMRRIATWTARQIQAAGEEAFDAGRQVERALSVNKPAVEEPTATTITTGDDGPPAEAPPLPPAGDAEGE